MSFLTHVICDEEQRCYDKPDPDHTFRGRLDGTRQKADEVVYEDDVIFAFKHNVDPTLDHWWETHIVIIPKRWIPTLLDIGIGDMHVWTAMIAGIQKVALKLGLHKTGFMVRSSVLPPYQHTEHVHIHILAGEHRHPHTDGPLSEHVV